MIWYLNKASCQLRAAIRVGVALPGCTCYSIKMRRCTTRVGVWSITNGAGRERERVKKSLGPFEVDRRPHSCSQSVISSIVFFCRPVTCRNASSAVHDLNYSVSPSVFFSKTAVKRFRSMDSRPHNFVTTTSLKAERHLQMVEASSQAPDQSDLAYNSSRLIAAS